MGDNKNYPTLPDTEGFFYATKEEESEGIRSKKYENGSEIKEVKLNNGRVATIRKLRGRDFIETKKRVQGDRSLDFETVNMSVATTFDGKSEPPEYFLDDLFQHDFAKLTVCYATINF